MNPGKGFDLHPEAAAGISGIWAIIAGEYLIAYAPDEDPLLVIAVIHGRRSPRTIAAMLREREP